MQARRPILTLDVDGENVVAQSAHINLSYNQVARATVITHRKIEAYTSAQEVTGSTVGNAVGEMQQAIYTGNNPECKLSLSDGQGGSVTMSGFLSSPEYGLQPGNVNYHRVILHEDAKLDIATCAVYEDFEIFRYEPLSKIDPVQMNRRILDVMEAMIKHWVEQHDKRQSGGTTLAEVRALTHATNLTVLPIFYRILQNSAMGFEYIKDDELLDIGVRLNNLNPTIWNLLSKTGGTLLSSMFGLAESFQSLYIPALEGNGRIINRELIAENPLDISIPIGGLRLSGGNPGLLPIANIYIRALEAPRLYVDGKVIEPTVHYAARWPLNPVPSGAQQPITGPIWAGNLYQQTATESVINRLNSYSLKSVMNWKKSNFGNPQKRDKETKYVRFLQRWARNAYIWNTLHPARAEVTIPMDLSIQAGRYYNVSDINSSKMFRGFLMGLDHNIQTSLETASASTTLRFSHVESGDFTLPYTN